MKRKDVIIGQAYRAKISGKQAKVRITGESPYGGWDGINVETGKAVRIRSPQRLRFQYFEPAPVEPGQDQRKEDSMSKKSKSKKEPAQAGETMSGLQAAAKVLSEAGTPLNAKEILERVKAQGLWKTSGRTPQATLYSGMIREIARKGEAARFRKAEKGKFTAAV